MAFNNQLRNKILKDIIIIFIIGRKILPKKKIVVNWEKKNWKKWSDFDWLDLPGQLETLAVAWQVSGRPKASVTFIWSPKSGSFRSFTITHKHFLLFLSTSFSPLQQSGVGAFASPLTYGRHVAIPANCCVHSSLSFSSSPTTKLTVGDVSSSVNKRHLQVKWKPSIMLSGEVEEGQDEEKLYGFSTSFYVWNYRWRVFFFFLHLWIYIIIYKLINKNIIFLPTSS